MPGSPRRVDRPLTPEQQELVCQAMGTGDAYAARYAALYRYRDLDFRSAVYLRLCQHAPEFDPSRSHLVTWASMHAKFACEDLVRTQIPNKMRSARRGMRIAKFYSLEDGVRYGDGNSKTFHDVLQAGADASEFEQEDNARGLLAGLSERETTILWGWIVRGEPLKSLGARYGISESRASQLAGQALAHCRRRLQASA